jgi:hypothetical protein
LLGLFGQNFELLTRMFGRKLDESLRRFGARQLLQEFEGGFGVCVSELKQFAVVVLYTTNRR